LSRRRSSIATRSKPVRKERGSIRRPVPEQLHGHHQIEDHYYFPLLHQKDPRIETSFDLLDVDHHALNGFLNRFVATANETIWLVDPANALVSAARFRDETIDLERLIGPHLEDEEDLIVQVILQSCAQGIG